MFIDLLLMSGPAIIAAMIYCKLQNHPLKTKRLALYSILFGYFINTCILVIAYLRGHAAYPTVSIYNNIGVSMKYIASSLVAAIILPIITKKAFNYLSADKLIAYRDKLAIYRNKITVSIGKLRVYYEWAAKTVDPLTIKLKRIGNWISARSAIVLAFIILLQVMTMVYYTDQKKWFHLDEMLSFSQANGSLETSRARNVENFYNNWNDTEFYNNLLSVQPGERFDFKTVYHTITKVTVHPPFYHIQLHGVSSLFPNIWSKWIGAGINIFWLIGAIIMLYKASQLVFKNNLLALLPSLVFGFSGGAISSAVFFRMYATLAFFFTSLIYLGLLIISGKSKVDLKFCIFLVPIIFFGSLTNYHFIIFFALTAVSLLLWLLFQKEYKQILYCVATTIFSYGAYLLFWPHAISELLYSGRSIESVENLVIFSDFPDRVKRYIQMMDRDLFGGALPVLSAVLFLLAAVGIILLCVRKVKLKFSLKNIFISDVFMTVFISFISGVFFLFIANSAPNPGNRYVLAVYPTLVLLFLMLLYRALSGIHKKTAIGLLVVVALFIASSDAFNKHVDYLYSNAPDVAVAVYACDKPSLIVVPTSDTPGNRIERYLCDFLQFNQTFICRTTDNFDAALDGVDQGQEIFIYVHRDFKADEILEHMRDRIPFQDAERIYTNGVYRAYRIEW